MPNLLAPDSYTLIPACSYEGPFTFYGLAALPGHDPTHTLRVRSSGRKPFTGFQKGGDMPTRATCFPTCEGTFTFYGLAALPKLWLFFFKIESGIEVFASTDWLSPCMYTGSSQGIPIILSLYLKPPRYSQSYFITTNSASKMLLLKLSSYFECQYTRESLRYTRKPVLNRLVTVSDAWSESTSALIINGIPLGSDMFPGNLVHVQTPTKSNPSFNIWLYQWLGHSDQTPTLCCVISLGKQRCGKPAPYVPPLVMSYERTSWTPRNKFPLFQIPPRPYYPNQWHVIWCLLWIQLWCGV